MKISRQFRVRGYSGRTTEAIVELRELTPPERTRRAVTGLLAWWGAMVVCVFIPIAHFVLVPGCFVMGLVTLFRRMGQGTLIASARATCPDCGAEQVLDMKGPFRGLSDIVCRQCQRSLTASPAGATQ